MSNFLRFSIVLIVKSNCECGTFIISHELIVLIRHLPADGVPCCSHVIVSLCQATKTYKKTIQGSSVTWQTMVRSVSYQQRVAMAWGMHTHLEILWFGWLEDRGGQRGCSLQASCKGGDDVKWCQMTCQMAKWCRMFGAGPSLLPQFADANLLSRGIGPRADAHSAGPHTPFLWGASEAKAVDSAGARRATHTGAPLQAVTARHRYQDPTPPESVNF